MKEPHTAPNQVRIDGRERKARRKYKSRREGMTSIVLAHVTNFIWLTPTDVLAIVEQVEDRLDENSVSIILYNLVKRGDLEKRTCWQYGRVNGYQVKRPVAQ